MLNPDSNTELKPTPLDFIPLRSLHPPALSPLTLVKTSTEDESKTDVRAMIETEFRFQAILCPALSKVGLTLEVL